MTTPKKLYGLGSPPNGPHGFLGKSAPRLDKRTLRLHDYLTLAFAPPPLHVNWLTAVKAWPVMLNDVLGDCVCAAAGHMVEQWSTYTGKPVTPPDASILAMYEQVGGYIPGNSASDQGCDMLTALNWWRQTGIATPGGGIHKITAFASVAIGSPTQVKESIELLGNCYLGLALPLSAQGAASWVVPAGGPFGDGSPGSWGGHCVPVVSYDPTGLIAISWGQRVFMSWDFLAAYCDEAYAVLSPDWIGSKGLSPSRFSMAALQEDLAAL